MTHIVLDPSRFSELALSRCLSFLYTGTTGEEGEGEGEGLTKESEELSETIAAAHLLDLPELALMCENARKGEEFLNPSIGTWLNDRNGQVAKEMFFNKVTCLYILVCLFVLVCTSILFFVYLCFAVSPVGHQLQGGGFTGSRTQAGALPAMRRHGSHVDWRLQREPLKRGKA